MIKIVCKSLISIFIVITFNCCQKGTHNNVVNFSIKCYLINDYSGFIIYRSDTINFIVQESIDQSFGIDLKKYIKLQYFDIDNHQLLDSLNLLNKNSLFLDQNKIKNIHYSESTKSLVLITKTHDSINLNIKGNYFKSINYYIENNYKIELYEAIKFEDKKLLARVENMKKLMGITFFVRGVKKDIKLSKKDIEKIIDFSR